MRNLVLPLLISLFSQVYAISNDIYFERISPESGFAFNTISSIMEDHNGLLWFACNNRLYHYNTSTIEEYNLYNDSISYSNPNIIKIIESDNGVSVCTTTGLYQFNKEKKTFNIVNIHLPDASSAIYSEVSDFTFINDSQAIIIIEKTAYIWTKGKKVVRKLSNNKRLNNNISFLSSNQDKLLIGTFRGEVYTYNTKVSDEPKLIYRSDKGYIRTICKDGNKYLLGFHDSGIDVIDLFGNYIESYNAESQGRNHIPHNMVRHIIRRDNGEIWIGTYKGLIIKDNNKKTIINYESGRGLPHNSIYHLVQGINGGIWVGTWAGGIAYYRPCHYKFKHIMPLTKGGIELQSAVTAFSEDSEGNIWIASERDGTNLFQSNVSQLEKQPTAHFSEVLSQYIPKDIMYMSPHQLVILDFNVGPVILDLKNGQVESLEKAYKEKNMRLKNTVESIAILNGKIWLFNENQLISYGNTEGIRTYELENNTPKDIRIKAWNVYFDSAHNLWLCTTNGLYVKYKNSETVHKCLKGHPLENENIFTCCEDVNGQIWIGTSSEGPFIYHPESDQTSTISQNKDIQSLDVYSIVRSHNNDIWFSSNKGIYHCFGENNIQQYSEEDGLSGKQYKPNSGFVCSNGQILFGALNGYNVITPEFIKENKVTPKVMLSEFKINNQPLSSKNSAKVNTLDIYNLNQISLKHAQNTISLKVISNNYVSPSKNKFKYRLVNYNDEWTEIGNDRLISYTKIPAGHYTFEAYGSNNDGMWNAEPYKLQIRILPAPWFRLHFILIYLLIVSSLGFWIYRNIKSRLSLKKSFEEEKQKSELNDSIHQERVKFFVNISHELRTPLSLILSPVHSLMRKYENVPESYTLLNTIDRNSKRLLRLTDQTLDFRLLEMGKLKPRLRKTDVIQLAIDTYTFFEHRILENKINFTFYSDFKMLQVMMDSDMIEKIIFNLVSNAIDYTPVDGEVKLSVKKIKINNKDYKNVIYTGHKFSGPSIEIKIEDSGIGIEQTEVPELFKRFTKAATDSQSKSGIGLHLCSEYATLNDGNIMVSSSLGRGATFTLNLPVKDETEFSGEKQKHIISGTSDAQEESVAQKPNMIDITGDEIVSKSMTILIIDNNKELLSYLKKYLSKTLRVTTANNSMEALKILNQLTPDIILTEISLPDNDGHHHIERIKSNKNLAHIPIIVLSQLTEKKHQVECLKLGVDAYLNKPVEEELLLAQINNIISRKGKVISSPIKNSSHSMAVNTSTFDGSTFTAVAEKIVMDNLQKINFDANTLAEKMKVSYSTLFRRIKRETNISATQFIRDIRLKKGVQLLKDSDLSIDEIGTSIGFNSTSYFVRSFKRKYDKTPSEYRKTQQ